MKLRSFLISGLVAVSLAGCSSGGGPQEVKKASSEDKPKIETTTTSSKEVKENTRTVTSESQTGTSSSETTSNVGFKDGVATLDDIDIKITKHAIIQPGEEGNMHGDKPVIAFWYDTTNKSGKEITPVAAWIAVFKAVQDNDPNMENKLEVAGLPDNQYLNTQTNNIKKDGTVSNAFAYTLSDTTTPVTLIANQGLMGKELGKQDYAIK